MTEEVFTARIRQSEGLSRAVLSGIEIDRGTRECLFEIITDRVFSEEDEKAALAAAEEAAPSGLLAKVRIEKRATDVQIVRQKTTEYIGRYAAASACISDGDIEIAAGDPVRIRFGVDEAERQYFEGNPAILKGLVTFLGHNFCASFTAELSEKSKPVSAEEAEYEDDEEPEVIRPRTFPVSDLHPVDEIPEDRSATYLADCNFTAESLTVCGRIVRRIESMSRAGREYLRLVLDDGTGSITCSYFYRKKTEAKIRALQEGEWVCCSVAAEPFNGRMSFRAKTICLGKPPEGFVPEKRKSRPVPAHYTCVMPEEISDYTQADMFAESSLPEEMLRTSFVVLDLETTGLVATTAGGAEMDRITEIGAVRIENGRILKKFSTLVDPERKLTPEITQLTGITDEMLKGKPKIGEVIPDFFKFCDGCILVAHNAQFDMQFVRHYASEAGYFFEQRVLDTLSMSQELLYLSNYKLNTLADHFGFTFRHHRAWDDAFVTAKIFIELVRMKGKLP